jgi:hypothetical protein
VPRLVALLLTMVLCTCVARAQQPCDPPAPPTLSRESNIFSEEQEVFLGDAVAEHLQRNFRVIEDDKLTAYLDQLGDRLVKHLPSMRLKLQFFVVDLPEANAFTLPGGRVYVSRKLVALTQSEDELAGVIAHELGHMVARHNAVEMTRLLRDVLKVTEVGDRRDIFEKYNRLVENAARNPKALGSSHEDKDQGAADRIGLYALVAAGYDPQAQVTFFDRLAGTKGNTGNFFGDLFGATRTESKRLREMIKTVGTLPAACRESRRAAPTEEYRAWQSVVVNYTGAGRREALHAVRSKTVLDPPLRGEISHLRFSPDGRYLLAQDDSGISVLTREPLASVFRIDAADARPAQFTPDSRFVVFNTTGLRVEAWDIAGRKLESARELFVRASCVQTLLSPDGKTLACLDTDWALTLHDVASGTQFVQKKSFATPNPFQLILIGFLMRSSESAFDVADIEWIKMGFSPDGRYFAAGSRNLQIGFGPVSMSTKSLGVDVPARKEIDIRSPLGKVLPAGFTFVGSDKVIAVDSSDSTKSGLFAFPSGQALDPIPLGPAKLAAATRGNFLLVRPITGYPVGVMDLSAKKFTKANKQSAFDLYEDVFTAERRNGEVGLYGVEKNDLRAVVLLPRSSLGTLRAVAVSRDLKLLALSGQSRGAAWDLSTGKRVSHVRGFRGAWFGDDGALYADFPKFENTERTIVKIDLRSGESVSGPEIKDSNARQYGPFVLVTKPATEGGGYGSNVVLEMHDTRGFAVRWTRTFAKEAPDVWVDADHGTVVLAWPVSAEAAKAIAQTDPALGRRLASKKEKEQIGDYMLQVLDAKTGEPIGKLLVETGKGSFQISNVFAARDWVVISDTENRVLLYALASGEQKGRAFGARAALSPDGRLLCVENEPSRLTVYDTLSMEKRDEFAFSSPVVVTRFGADGTSLLAVTADQTVYVLDVVAK